MIFFIFLSLFSSSTWAQIEFPQDFEFGLATAPAHVEDQLDDIWLDFAKENKISAFKNYFAPEKRLEFWTKPEIEINLAHEANIGVFRLGVDWGRLAPSKPKSLNCQGPCALGVQDEKALARYQQIIALVKAKKMKVMLTLFHHSLPKWALEMGGWTNKEVREYFYFFALDVIKHFNRDVDYWITFNEPNIFALLSHVVGIWPPGVPQSYLHLVNLGFVRGDYAKAMHLMSKAHNDIYEQAHLLYPNIKIGMAHHYSYHRKKEGENNLSAKISKQFLNWGFPDKVKNHVDFIGVNYYGAEYLKGFSTEIADGVEYSEAGRAVSPFGFYRVLKDVYARYKKPILVTENGIADSTDWIRPSYMLEHLAALYQAMSEGVDIRAYIFWTISDNWEWADGYCPKFGLVEVIREDNFKRIKRESFHLFAQIVKDKRITEQMRMDAWQKLKNHQGMERPFCRHEDGVRGLDQPRMRKVVSLDWRFSAF